MSRTSTVTGVIDDILMVGLGGGVIAAGLTLPGSTIALGPLFARYTKTYDERRKQREYRRIVMYMKRQGLLDDSPRAGNGLVLSRKGLKRAQKAHLTSLQINTSTTWDKKWRIVLFDVPEKMKLQRDNFTAGLRRLGMYQLQKSVWLHPLPCREEISALALYGKIDQYLTFIEADHIDCEEHILPLFAQLNLQK